MNEIGDNRYDALKDGCGRINAWRKWS